MRWAESDHERVRELFAWTQRVGGSLALKQMADNTYRPSASLTTAHRTAPRPQPVQPPADGDNTYTQDLEIPSQHGTADMYGPLPSLSVSPMPSPPPLTQPSPGSAAAFLPPSDSPSGELMPPPPPPNDASASQQQRLILRIAASDLQDSGAVLTALSGSLPPSGVMADSPARSATIAPPSPASHPLPLVIPYNRGRPLLTVAQVSTKHAYFDLIAEVRCINFSCAFLTMLLQGCWCCSDAARR